MDARLRSAGVCPPALTVIGRLTTHPWQWVPSAPPPPPPGVRAGGDERAPPVAVKWVAAGGDAFPVSLLVSDLVRVFWATVDVDDVAAQLQVRWRARG